MSFTLNKLLGLTDDYSKAKVKFNQWNGADEPIELFVKEPETVNNQWLFWRNNQRYFNVGEIAICLVRMPQLSKNTWLLTTIKRVTKEFGKKNDINYEGDELPQYSHLYGKVIIQYNKSQSQREWLQNCDHKLEVLQILPSPYDGEEFRGYDKVRLSWKQLEIILLRKKSSWINALSNQKAVYLITDTNNGKHYVGSATSKSGMLLSRWLSYIDNGHGGNKELREIYDDLERGFEYIKNNFQYTILENYNQRVDDGYIKVRETWWKETLHSRKFGYNKN